MQLEIPSHCYAVSALVLFRYLVIQNDLFICAPLVRHFDFSRASRTVERDSSSQDAVCMSVCV